VIICDSIEQRLIEPVLVHVEEFKKELSREVLTMTQEVGRLQRERQALEQQIAELFAFFAKQRAEEVGRFKRCCSVISLTYSTGANEY
jgi:septal ring factor EnvC (AmiA/AmiB activator)